MTNFDYRISANSFPPFNSFCGKYSIYAVKNCHPAVTYAAAKHQGLLFWTCKRLKLQRKTGHLQLIQNSAPSVAAPSMLHPNNAETIWKFSHFTLSKKNSFHGNYSRKYGIWILSQKVWSLIRRNRQKQMASKISLAIKDHDWNYISSTYQVSTKYTWEISLPIGVVW